MARLNTLIISISFSLLVYTSLALNIGTISSCITNYTASSTNTAYQTALQTLFSNLTSSSSSSSSPFHTSSAGSSPNQAYALSLCRGDTSSDACHTCAESITAALTTRLPFDSCEEGFMYMDDCMVHYANHSFFGTSNNDASMLVLDKFVATDFVTYNTTLEGVLKGVISDAIANNATLFATREGGDGQETVYALAQCTRDLDRGACSGCLNAALVALRGVNATQPGVVKAEAALLPSCQLRYDNVSFYGASSAGSNPPAEVSAFVVATLGLFLTHLLLG